MVPRNRLDIRWSDLLFGIGACLRPGVSVGAARTKLECTWSADGDAVAFLSVRSGFDLVLRALQFPKGSEILVSAVTIRDMARIIEEHGCVAVPVDMDMRTLAVDAQSIESHVNDRTRAVLAAHLFGGRTAMDDIVDFAGRHGLFVFEDCAQAYAGPHERGHRGCDVSMFSFGPIKTATALGGALFRFTDPGLRDKVASLQSHHAVQSNRAFLSRLLKYALLKAIINPPCFEVLYHACRLAGTTHDRLIGGAVRGFAGPDFFDRIRKQPGSALCALLDRRIRRFDRSTIDNRIEAAAFFIDVMPSAQRPGASAARHTHWVFPIETESPDAFVRHLWTCGFDATRGASNMSAIDPPKDRACAIAARARCCMDKVVYLPVYAGLSSRTLARLARAVSSFGGQSRLRPEIALVRHGKPAIWRSPQSRRFVAGRALTGFLREYDASGIDEASLPPAPVVDMARNARAVFRSATLRTQESARVLASDCRPVVETLFGEAEFPSGYLKRLRLPPAAWMAVSRFLWRCGFSPNAEPYRAAIKRAHAAALLLHRAALREERVMLVGHGIMNWLIAKELRAMGWKRHAGSGFAFWGCTVLSW